jgi:hypothetical protein
MSAAQVRGEEDITMLKKWIAIMLVTLSGACITDLGDAGDENNDLAFGPGNGAPSGTHFNLNLIGVSNDKNVSFTGGDGRRIFMPLFGTARVNLSEGDFAVLDANGTDGTAAFRLPNPDPDGDGITSYSVFARALGKPGGSSVTATCATDVATGELVCSTDTLVSTRTKGKQTFSNVSKQLLFVTADVDGDGVVERVPLFDDRLEDFFWSYDNNGLKVLQLRFYEVATNVNQ